MHRALGVCALVIAAIPLAAVASGESGSLVVASCDDGSVVLAKKWSDVRCAGAVRLPRGFVPRVGSTRDRAAALAWEREAGREKALDAQLDRLVPE